MSATVLYMSMSLDGFITGPDEALAPIAGTIEITTEMAAKAQRAEAAIDALVARAHAAGVLRPDVTAVDIALDGLRHAAGGPLPGPPPSARLITERWAPPDSSGDGG